MRFGTGASCEPGQLSPRLGAPPLSSNGHVRLGLPARSRVAVRAEGAARGEARVDLARNLPQCRERALVGLDYGRTTLFASTPIFSTSASMRSPALRKLPVAAPTPSGVPVAMMSPGSTVMLRERTSMH